MKQSSIEWVASQLEKLIPSGNQLVIGAILEQAKAMHKEEIENAYWDGGQWIPLAAYQCEDYYNETFNTEECYHKGKYTYNKETFECHKCGLIVPNEYRFNSKEK